MSFEFTTFQRIMLTDFVRYLLYGIIAFGGILALAGLPEFLSGTVESGVLAVEFAHRILPLSLLVSTLFTVGIRTRYLEIMAFNTAGISLVQVTWPLLIPAVLGFTLSLMVYLWGEPSVAEPATIFGGTSFQVQNAVAQSSLSIVAVLIGIVVASGSRRPKVSSRFITAGVLMVAYYVVDATARALGKHTFLPIELAIWVSVVLAGVPSGFVWLRGGWR